MKSHVKKLSELPATAICGNDISSSCLYVSALAIIYAGQYAWLALIIVAVVLFFFRRIYGEVVGAMPLNGGAYNALLNTTSKMLASLAATLTLLSYMATAVLSANEAVHYVHSLWDKLPITAATIILLAMFMGLVINGIGESSRVAIFIFITHIVSLILLTGVCVWFIFTHGFSTLIENFQTPVKGSIGMALIFGFSAAMLGISGFESSANFVEEQQRGVFPKTLRNMWIVVSIFNPLMAFLALSTLPMTDVAAHQETLLAHMGEQTGGQWLSILISVDAALVLSGAVLTSFVGVGGLVERMALDRVLPKGLLKKNKKGSSYMIMIVFFVLCTSILLITRGELTALAGVYTISFLAVMALFAIGNILLKIRRASLPRPEKASAFALFIAISAVGTALVGNAIMNPQYLKIFLQYFIPAIILILVMLKRTAILQFFLQLIQQIFRPLQYRVEKLIRAITRKIDQINSQEFVFFTRGDNVEALNNVILYILRNELTHKLKIVTFVKEGQELPPRLESDLEVLDREYSKIKIEFHKLEGDFTPERIEELSEEWNIPMNLMFMGSPGSHFPFRIEEFNGVRLII